MVKQWEPSCNGICLTGFDLGVPEYRGIAYAHPECEVHGDPEYGELDSLPYDLAEGPHSWSNGSPPSEAECN